MKAAEKVWSVLHRGIIEGDFPPGARITESDVAARAGVSRTPVREALRRLEIEGLIRFVPNQGAFVSDWSDADASDVFDLRSLLEGYAARLCAERIDARGLEELRGLASEQLEESRRHEARRRGAGGRLERIAELNARFHRCLRAGASSERLNASLAALTNAPLVLQTFRDYTDAELVRSATHHLEIVHAIAARDPAWAESVMRSHVLAARGAFFARRAERRSRVG